MDWITLASILIVALVVLLLIDMPVAFSLGLVSMVAMFFLWGGWTGVSVLATTAFTQVGSFVLLAIPLFLLMAEAILATGISGRAFKALDKWTTSLPGGIGIASNLFCTGFGAVTGFAPATVAAIGTVAVPEMLERGYDPKLALGLIGGGASLAILIPPSILMILYGELSGASVGKMFMGGIIPGILTSVFFMVYIVLVAKITRAAPPLGKKFSLREKITSLGNLLPFLFIILIVLGSIWGGIATPTEAAGVGAFFSLCLAAIYKGLSWSSIKAMLTRTISTTCMLFMILVGATGFTQIVSYLGVTASLSEFVATLDVAPLVIVFAMQLVIFFLGMIVDAGSIVCITVPIFGPSLAILGYDPLLFGLIMMVNLSIATLTPPVGLNLFILRSVAPGDMEIMQIARGAAPFVGMLILTLVLLVFFPQIGLWLPNLMVK